MLQVGTIVKITSTSSSINTGSEFIGTTTEIIKHDAIGSREGYLVKNNDLFWIDEELQVIRTPDQSNSKSGLYISRMTRNRIKDICGVNPAVSIIPADRGDLVYYESAKSLGSSKGNYIKNGPSGEFWIHNKEQKIKLGKVLGQIVPDLDSTEIEAAVSKWKQTYKVDTSKVIISDRISEIYDISDVGGSCMADHGEYMEIYEDVGCHIAYILDDKGLLGARCLFWDKNIQQIDTGETVSRYDRIFFKNEGYKLTLEKYFKDKDIPIINDEGTYRTIRAGKGYYPDGVPYIDSMYLITTDYRLTNNYDGGSILDELQTTNGASNDDSGISGQNNGVYCEDSGNTVHEDDAIWVESEGCYYQYDDELIYVESQCGYYDINHDDIVNTEDEGYQHIDDCVYDDYDDVHYYYDDDLVCTEDSGLRTHIDNTVELDGGGFELTGNCTYIEDTGVFILTDNLDSDYVEHKGAYYTRDYYEEEHCTYIEDTCEFILTDDLDSDYVEHEGSFYTREYYEDEIMEEEEEDYEAAS